MNFNTVYPPLNCPFCAQTVSSGVGFRVGALMGKQYRIGDSIVWEGGPTRPESRPPAGNIRSIGYFNCDNIKCSSWSDCFPEVQLALVVVENNVIVAVELPTRRATPIIFTCRGRRLSRFMPHPRRLFPPARRLHRPPCLLWPRLFLKAPDRPARAK